VTALIALLLTQLNYTSFTTPLPALLILKGLFTNSVLQRVSRQQASRVKYSYLLVLLSAAPVILDGLWGICEKHFSAAINRSMLHCNLDQEGPENMCNYALNLKWHILSNLQIDKYDAVAFNLSPFYQAATRQVALHTLWILFNWINPTWLHPSDCNPSDYIPPHDFIHQIACHWIQFH
jgi:hypothetical protein